MADVLMKLLKKDGSWDRFEDCWRRQCEEHEEEYDQYALGSLPALRDLAADDRDDAGVFALTDGNGLFDSVAQVNSAALPKYTGKVLRVRHMLFSPHFDYGEYPIEKYMHVLSQMFTKTVALSVSGMPSQHVKFHLRSPADRQFFSAVVNPLDESGMFGTVAMRGSWLYLSLKNQLETV